MSATGTKLMPLEGWGKLLQGLYPTAALSSTADPRQGYLPSASTVIVIAISPSWSSSHLMVDGPL